MGNWTLVNKFVADVRDHAPGGRTMWKFRFEHNDTSEQALVMAENEDHAWEKLTDGEYEKEYLR